MVRFLCPTAWRRAVLVGLLSALVVGFLVARVGRRYRRTAQGRASSAEGLPSDEEAEEDRPRGRAASQGPSSEFLPSRLGLAPSFGIDDVAFIHDLKTGKVPEISVPCDTALLSPRHLFVCNYTGLFLIDLEAKTSAEIAPPPGVKRWVPTGLAYRPAEQLLYVANFQGKNVLACRFTAQHGLELVREYTNPKMVGPENVAVSQDGSRIAVGDYDGEAVLLFHRDGRLLWSYPVGLCHGVAFHNGDRHVLASSLAGRQVFQLDAASGALVTHVGGSGWGKDSYLYPISISTNARGEIAVADAHTGKVSFLDPDLHMVGCLGGNGADDTLFNEPYDVQLLEDGKLLVVDTMRPRLVFVDRASRAIDKVYYLHRGYQYDAYSLPGSALYRGDCAAAAESPRVFCAPDTPPLGAGYDAWRTNRARAVSLRLPLLGPGFPSAWHEGYSELVEAGGSRQLDLLSATPLYAGSYLYFVFGVNHREGGRDYTLLWSQSGPVVLCVRDGVAVPLPLKLDLWRADGNLLDHGHVILAANIVRAAEQRLAAYERLIRQDRLPVLEALRRALLPWLDGLTFLTALEQTFQSARGKEFLRSYRQAAGTDEQLRVVENFCAAVRDSDQLRLPELFVCHTLAHGLRVGRQP